MWNNVPLLLLITIIIGLSLNLITCSSLLSLTYEDARNAVINTEQYLSTGGQLKLNSKEILVNEVLMDMKTEELMIGHQNPEKLISAMHFFHAKHLIEQSKVYKFLQLMPKGALLHGHNSALVSSAWIIRNLTYYPGVLRCRDGNGVVILSFRKSKSHNCSSNYVLVETERKHSRNITIYDQELEKTINLYTPTPEVDYRFISTVWNKFQNMFNTIGDLILYMPAFRAFHWRLLEEMYNDGIFYIELRMSFKECYDETGKIYTKMEVVHELQNLVKEFQIQHPGFFGLKIINTCYRNVKPEYVDRKLQVFRKFYEHFPNFVIGFDLVGQEDIGKPLINFVNILQNLPAGAKFFFHAGETNWYCHTTDYNILDAILMNTTRIGHGYGLIKHPVLWNSVKKRNIAIEVNPISNQVLNLVGDLRNHPAAFYLSENIPIVIANDDPGFWSAQGLSYDFYYVLMSIGSNRAGLGLLKQLVWNSIKYSVLTEDEQQKAMNLLQTQWNQFLDKVLSTKF